jgi:hypothetical protein
VNIDLFLKDMVLVEPDLGKRWKYTPLQIHLTHILHTGALIRETLEPDSKDNYRASRRIAIWRQANVTKEERVSARFS